MPVLIALFTALMTIDQDVPVARIVYTVERTGGADVIALRDGCNYREPGQPDIPSSVFGYALPAGTRLVSVEVLDTTWRELPGEYVVAPRQARVAIGGAAPSIPPDPLIYSSPDAFPQAPIAGFTSGNLRGTAVAQIAVTPFSYLPAARTLRVLQRFRIRLHLAAAELGVTPQRETRLAQQVTAAFLRGAVCSSVGVTLPPVHGDPGDRLPSDLPSLTGPAVDMVIVTTEALANAYRQWVEFKKDLGFNPAVRTVNWIRQHYSGVDDAERIRAFLKDACEKWGTTYVLLGGDVPDVPTRMAHFVYPWATEIASDLYFSCLDGNWNRDGDHRFGEIEDSVDLYPELFVGRITQTTAAGVTAYLERERGYLFPDATDHLDRALFLCSDFIPGGNDALVVAQRLANHLPPWFTRSFLNESDPATVRDSIQNGHGLITILGHGDVNLYRVHSTWPRQFVSNFYFDSLANDDQAVMLALTCYTNPFQSDCLGEHWVNSPGGGGLGYLGPTSSSSAYDHEYFIAAILDRLYANAFSPDSQNSPLGAALTRGKLPFLPEAQWENWKRIFVFSIALLGDPSLPVWDSIPGAIAAAVITPETLEVGLDTLCISVQPELDSFEVVLHKSGELFTRFAGASGYGQAPVRTETAGYVTYVVHAPRRIPFIDSFLVAPAQPVLAVAATVVLDTSGNQNGVPNPGEALGLKVCLKNTGGAAATGVRARLVPLDDYARLHRDTTSYADIAPADTTWGTSWFEFDLDHRTPDEHGLTFALDVEYSGLTRTDSFQIMVVAPRLSLHRQQCRVVEPLVVVRPWLENSGSCVAESVFAVIRALSDTVVVLDSMVYFGDILAGTIADPAPDTFEIRHDLPGAVRFDMQLFTGDNLMAILHQVVDTVAPPDTVWTAGLTNSIAVNWTACPGARGYRVHRSTSESGPFVFLRNPLAPIAFYEDNTAEPDVSYYYYITTLDSSMNESNPSATMCGRTNPRLQPGWPRIVYGHVFSSPNFGDIDPTYPGLEIVVGCKDGAVYAWHVDGTPVCGDGRLYQAQTEIWSSPAIGDLNGDGMDEIVIGIRGTDDHNLVCLDYQGTPLNGWPLSLAGGILTSPVLGDLDGDGDLEIVVASEAGVLYAFHHDGSGVFSPSGIVKSLPGGMSATPCIADLDQDGNLEIVCPGGNNSDSLFVWKNDGTYLAPFPLALCRRMNHGATCGNVSGNDRLEIALYTDSSDCLHLINAEGDVLWQSFFPLGDVEAAPIITDLTGDGKGELVCGNNLGLLVFDSLGNLMPGYPGPGGHNYKMPVAADVDNDGRCDVVIGSSNRYLYGLQEGATSRGFPMLLYNGIDASPLVYDLDRDGRLELVVADNGFRVYMFQLDGAEQAVTWPKFHYDPYNSGTYQSGNLPVLENRGWESGPARLSLRATPTPFRNSVEISYNCPTCQAAKIAIYDAAGRLIREIHPARGQTAVTWDGRDGAGQNVASGVYFVRCETSAANAATKTVLLR